MYVLIAISISVVIIAGLAKIYLMFKVKIDFFLKGLDEGFKIPELITLWNVADICKLEQPVSIFDSMPSLTKCISQIKSHSETGGAISSARYQALLTKLYAFRNSIEKAEDKKRGLDSTQSLDVHQKLRIILPGRGVFSSEIVNNGREIIIKLPTQKGQITLEGKEWNGQSINVYLWRKGDARYVFDTIVTHEGIFLGKPSLFLKHTTNLVRTQKRNAIRSKCHIMAELYILKDKVIDYNIIETKPGYKCLLEDISENGALIRIGGKGAPNVQMRIQFQVNNKLVVMFGIVRTVEYNQEINQSRLHFECVHIDPAMKNQVLSYVYNIMSDSEKEIYDAMTLTDKDESEQNDTSDGSKPVQGSSDENGNISQSSEISEGDKIGASIPETDDVLSKIRTDGSDIPGNRTTQNSDLEPIDTDVEELPEL